MRADALRPVLDEVGDALAAEVPPGATLLRVAEDRGWPVLRLG